MTRDVIDELLRQPLWGSSAFAMGLVVGSFANVCIHRLPLARSVVTPRSRCPTCGNLIAPWDNVPLLSWLLLRGRCRACGASISVRYPVVELVNAALWVGASVRFGVTPQALVAAGLCTALLVLTLIDLEHQILPDLVTLPGVVVGLAASFLPGSAITPVNAFFSALGGYLAFAGIWALWRVLRRIDALGQGDWKLAAMLGAFLGWHKLLLTVFLATFAGTLVGLGLMVFRGRDLGHALPLGTFLGIAALLALFFGDPVLAWYGGFYS